MPSQPGSSPPPPAPHEYSVHIAGGGGSRYAVYAICDFPGCYWCGETRYSYEEAEADRQRHVAGLDVDPDPPELVGCQPFLPLPHRECLVLTRTAGREGYRAACLFHGCYWHGETHHGHWVLSRPLAEADLLRHLACIDE